MDYFKYATGLTMTCDDKWQRLFGMKRRVTEDALAQTEANLALAIQSVTEEIVLKLAKTAINGTKSANLVMAGGVALNGVVNGKLDALPEIENLWTQPAAGDAGGALGAALATWHILRGKPRKIQFPDAMYGALLEPAFTSAHIEALLQSYPHLIFKKYDSEALLLENSALALTQGKIVGWFQGRMEFGPRALGNRSILADPRNPDMQQKINQKIKFREGFRPFAPSILEEDAREYFDIQNPSPYMLLVKPVSEKQRKAPNSAKNRGLQARLQQIRSSIPAVTHVDYSARIQTVNKNINPRYYKLLTAFKEKTGIGMLINTSFNVKDSPIVCSPLDAMECFLQTEMDVLVMEDYILTKKP